MPDDPDRTAARINIALGIGAFVGCGGGAWLAAQWLDTLLFGEPSALSGSGAYGAMAEVALVYGALVGAAFGVLHLVEHLSNRFAKHGLWVATALSALAALPFALRQAAFLTSGDGISASESVGLVRVGLGAAITLAFAGLWLWHRCLFTLPPRLEAHRSATTRLLWSLLGVVALALAVGTIATRLHYYAYFAMFATVPTAGIASTLAAVAVTRPWGRRVGTGLLFVLYATSLLDDDAARGPLRAQSALFEYGELLIQGEPDVDGFSIDVSAPARFACTARTSQTLPPVAGAPIRNVILISVDALRSDYAARFHGEDKLMPNLQGFADQSVQFADAQSPYPATVYALGGAFTGLSPSQISYAPGVPDTVFRSAGTKVDRRLAVLPRDEWFSMPIIGELLVQDAERTDGPLDAEHQADDMLAALQRARAANESVLAWVHFLEPHAPYQVHPETPAGGGPIGAYMSELRYLDLHLGRLLDGLEAGGWFDDSLVIIFSDHGEALAEDGYWGHHVYLDAWMTDVPLIVRAPGLAAGVVEAPVSIADIAPTVLHALGLPVRTDVDAVSLFRTLAKPDPRRAVFAEAFPVRGRELFERADEPIDSFDALDERLRQQQDASLQAYEPKVALIDQDVRLIVRRRSGTARLLWRADDSKADAQDRSATEAAVLADKLETMRQWHRVQSQRIYCRVVDAQR